MPRRDGGTETAGSSGSGLSIQQPARPTIANCRPQSPAQRPSEDLTIRLRILVSRLKGNLTHARRARSPISRLQRCTRIYGQGARQDAARDVPIEAQTELLQDIQGGQGVLRIVAQRLRSSLHNIEASAGARDGRRPQPTIPRCTAHRTTSATECNPSFAISRFR